MVRFGVVLSVVLAAFGLLAAGVVAGNLLLVVVSIGVAAVAFLMLAAVVLIWREEIFGTGAAHAQDRGARVSMAAASTSVPGAAVASTAHRTAEAPAALAPAPVIDADRPSVPSRREAARSAKLAARAQKEAATARRRAGRPGEPAGEPHSLADVFGAHSPDEPMDSRAEEETTAAGAAAVTAALADNAPARPVPTFRKAQSGDKAAADAFAGQATAGKAAEDGRVDVRAGDGGPARAVAGTDMAADGKTAHVKTPHGEMAAPAAAAGKATGIAADSSMATAAVRSDSSAEKVSRQDRDWRDRFSAASSLTRPAGDTADAAADRLRGDRDRASSPEPASRLERESARAARSVRDTAAPGGTISGPPGAGTPAAGSGRGADRSGLAGRPSASDPLSGPSGQVAARPGPPAPRGGAETASPARSGGDALPSATPRAPVPGARPAAVPAAGAASAGAAATATAGTAATRPASTMSSSAAAPAPAVGREPGPAATTSAPGGRDVGVAAGPATSKPVPGAVQPEPAADSGPAQPATAAAGAEPKAGQAVVSSSVRVVPGIARYHASDCLLIRFLASDDLEEMTREAAAAGGCVPCKACSPDQAAASVPVG